MEGTERMERFQSLVGFKINWNSNDKKKEDDELNVSIPSRV